MRSLLFVRQIREEGRAGGVEVVINTPNISSTYISLDYSNIYPTRCNFTQFILSGNCSTCFGWYHHPSSGAQTTVSTACDISHTVTAICRYRGRVGTGLSVLWVAPTAHSNRFQLFHDSGRQQLRCD